MQDLFILLKFKVRAGAFSLASISVGTPATYATGLGLLAYLSNLLRMLPILAGITSAIYTAGLKSSLLRLRAQMMDGDVTGVLEELFAPAHERARVSTGAGLSSAVDDGESHDHQGTHLSQ